MTPYQLMVLRRQHEEHVERERRQYERMRHH